MKYIKEIMILAICLMVLGFSASVLFGIWCMYQEGVSEYRGLQEFAEEESEADADDSGVVKKKTAVDFDSLKEINGDIVAWIKCKEMVDVSEGKYFRTVYSTEDFASLSEAIAAHTGNALVRGEHLLTLSTCNGNANRRHLILCKEVTETNEKQMEEGTAGEVIQIEAGQEETTATAQKGAAKETQEAETK